MKKNVNVIISKRGRDDYLIVCLHYLNKANAAKRYHINVYVVSDIRYEVNYTADNIDIRSLFIPRIDNDFNKSRLLNYGLRNMDNSFDWLSVVDLDMIYHKYFFNLIDLRMKERSYIITTGRQLDIVMTEKYRNFLIEPNYEIGPIYQGNSQISMSNNVYSLFKKIYGDDLYCEDFCGWGGEDSDVSFKAADMSKEGLIERKKITEMWLHMAHERNLDSRVSNNELFTSRRLKNKELLRRWLDENSNTNMQANRRA